MRLSSYFTKEEILKVNSGEMNISKKVEKNIRERASNYKSKSKLNNSKSSIENLKLKNISESDITNTPNFPIYNVYNDVYTDSLISSSISFNIQKELTNFCQNGQIQVDYNIFLNHMMKVKIINLIFLLGF